MICQDNGDEAVNVVVERDASVSLFMGSARDNTRSEGTDLTRCTWVRMYYRMHILSAMVETDLYSSKKLNKYRRFHMKPLQNMLWKNDSTWKNNHEDFH